MAAVLDVVGALLSTTVATTIAKGIVEPGTVTLTIVLTGALGCDLLEPADLVLRHPLQLVPLSGRRHRRLGGGWVRPCRREMDGHFLQGHHSDRGLSAAGVPGGRRPHQHHQLGLSQPEPGYHEPRVSAGPVGVVQRDGAVSRTQRRAEDHGHHRLGIVRFGNHHSALEVPTWVKIACAFSMGLGTFVGGKRIIRTLGVRLVKMTPVDGFTAQTATSCVLQGAAFLGCPISTTHVATTTIMGVGATHRLHSVRWGA